MSDELLAESSGDHGTYPQAHAIEPNKKAEPDENIHNAGLRFVLPKSEREDQSRCLGENSEDSDNSGKFRQLGHALASELSNETLDAYLSALPPIVGQAIGKYFMLPSGNLKLTDCAWIIFGLCARKRKMFWRDNAIVEIRVDPKGRLVLHPVTAEGFCSRIEELGYQVKVFRNEGHHGHKERLKTGRLQPVMARQFLDSGAAYELLPRIHLVLSCPAVTIGKDGTADFLKEGYNLTPLGGVFVARGKQPPRYSVEEASQILLALIGDYRFRKPGDKARALAWIITPALRLGGLLDCLTPFFLAEADRSQSAKSLLVQAIAAIYGEVCGTPTQRKGGVSSTDELFDTVVQKRRPFILLDNLDGQYESPRLESFLTSTEGFPVRGAYNRCEDVDPRFFYVYGSSNGFRCEREDLRNRSSIVQISSCPKGAYYRYFREALLRHIQTEQSRYLGAVCSIAAAWLEEGRQTTNETRHYFREWAQPLDWIVQRYFNDPSVGRLMDDEVTRMFTGTLDNEPSIDAVDVPINL